MPYRPQNAPDPIEPDDPLYDPRIPGRFRRAYVAVATIVIVALIIGLLGPIVWRLV